jgi:nicotinamide-nucleotide amidase
MIDETLEAAARETIAALERAGMVAVTAESCTGGLIAGALTAIAGSSAVLHGGFVTYANAAKTGMLGVPAATIAFVGAVSREVAAAMAAGARARTGADVAISVTGVAGPGGGTAEKPVGTVWFGIDGRGGRSEERMVFAGDRAAIRHATVLHALAMLTRDAGAAAA